MPHRVYIGIGSNLGDRKANTQEAVDRVSKLPGTRVVRASSLYESEPLGDAKTWFVNSVIEIETELGAEELLKKLKAIEKAMGRKRVKGKRWGSRVIDLDILFCNHEIVDKRSLKIPHPELHLFGLHYAFGLDPRPYYFLLLVLCALMIGVIMRLDRSRIGRAWVAIREDELAAAAMGVPTVRMKLWAFAIGASTAGVAGVVNASRVNFVSPDGFTLLTSIFILSMVVYTKVNAEPRV